MKTLFMNTPLILSLLMFATSLAPAAPRDPAPAEIGSLREPVALAESALLGLTEAQVLKQLNIPKLEREGDDPAVKSFPGSRSPIPPLGGYVYTRHHLLSFRDGKVVRHEVVDRVSACVINEPIAE